MKKYYEVDVELNKSESKVSSDTKMLTLDTKDPSATRKKTQ